MNGPSEPPRKKPRRREVTPAQRALGLLVRREHSKLELTRKLLARGIAEDEAVAAVGKMAQAGWQDDIRFACSLARTRASAGYGPVRIRAEIQSHGLGAEAVESAFAALAEAGEDDWPARAAEQVRKRFGAARTAPLATQRKAADFLLRRGFESDCIRAALNPPAED